jgi:hypothetical protein
MIVDPIMAKKVMEHRQIGTTDDGRFWICSCGHESRDLNEVAEHYVRNGMRDPRK